jgi:threonine dehydratase
MREPTIDGIRAARSVIAKHLPRTPTHSYPGLSALVGTQLWVKHENHHALGAFKVRGGTYLAATLDRADRSAGLITASTGNHGQSIAFGGRLAGVPVLVAVPREANPSKLAAMRALGAEIVEAGADFDEAREWAMEEAQRRGGRFIGPTEPELIEGVGTYALEILEDVPDVEVVIVPVGGGSGAAGTGLALHATHSDIEVIGVQATGAPAAYQSWRSGQMIEAEMHTAAEGLATRVPFANAQKVLREHLADFVLVSDDEIRSAALAYLRHAHALAELAGAAPLAAAFRLRERLAGRRIVLVLSGGNVSPGQLPQILAAGDLAGSADLPAPAVAVRVGVHGEAEPTR